MKLYLPVIAIFAEAKKEVSVVIIKPDAVQTGKAEEIMGEVNLSKLPFFESSGLVVDPK